MKFKFILLILSFALCSSIVFAQSGNASDNSNGSGATISSLANMYTHASNASDNTNGSSSTLNSIGSKISEAATSKSHKSKNANSKRNEHANIHGVNNGILENGMAKLNSFLNIFESNIF